MAWNEQYARILEQMKKNTSNNASITGAETVSDDPDCLFYTNFTRETAIAFYEVFDSFKGYYKSNPSIAIDRLKNNLKLQIDAIGDLCPLEVLLYSSRIIREYLTNRQVKNAIIAIIQQHIPNNIKSLQYILSGWEWPQILAIVIEACGNTNNDYAIKTAMDYCEKISKKFVEKNDNELLKSYIKMIENSQNENYLGYVTRIATIPQFQEDNQMADFLVKELRRDRFLSQYKETLASDIHAKTTNFSLKRSLEKIMDNNRGERTPNSINMEGLSYERKVKQVEALDFTKGTSAMLADFERSRESDNEIVMLTCKKILRDVAYMRSSDRNLAMILIGTKGSRIHAIELIETIEQVKNSHPDCLVTSLLALSELDQQKYPIEIAMNEIITNDDVDSWDWAVGKYFRFRKAIFEKNLCRAFSEAIEKTDNGNMPAIIGRLAKLIELFNGNNDLLSTQISVQNAIIDVVRLIISTDLSDISCQYVVALLDYMLPYSNSAVLALLDDVKAFASTKNYTKVITKINEVIKKGDLAREPD